MSTIIAGALVWMLIFWFGYLFFEKYIFSSYLSQWELRDSILTDYPRKVYEIQNEIKELKEEYNRRILEAKKEAEKIINSYTDEANAIAAKELEELDLEIKKMLEERFKKIEEEIETAREQLYAISQRSVEKFKNLLGF